jgi:RHH-type proline utilization regulon transcriptional repressor/proline dehydrogenase/delta 1-pyrroline-5-carboxylate dehydrogenase
VARRLAATVDLLGEKTLTAADADRYAERVAAVLPPSPGRRRAGPRPPPAGRSVGRLPQVHVSIKATALAPLLTPYTQREGIDEAMSRLGPLLDHAVRWGATIHLDSEHDEVKDATFALLREIGAAYPDGPQLGCVVQAYRTDAYDDLRGLIDWSAATLRRPLQVRLVKGAYWDAETITARAHRWASPVWPAKADSDANYERCARLLIERAGDVRPAFASHNLRSLAYALAAARGAGLPDDAVECQVLYGMATPLHGALRDLGYRTRIYVPIGELVPGMAYLVRRLLENTSNESSSAATPRRQRRRRPPRRTPQCAGAAPAPIVAPTDADDPGPVNEPDSELRRAPDTGATGALSPPPRPASPSPPASAASSRLGGDSSCRSTRAARGSRSAGPRRPPPATPSAVGVAHHAFSAWAARSAERAAVLFAAAAEPRRHAAPSSG